MPAPNNKISKANGNGLDVPALESWLWDAACTIRGPLDAPKFKDYILPLIFLKRLSDVFDDEVAHLAHEFGDPATAAKLELIEADRSPKFDMRKPLCAVRQVCSSGRHESTD
jgi:type I restriction-modification system DNA methylase subunit